MHFRKSLLFTLIIAMLFTFMPAFDASAATVRKDTQTDVPEKITATTGKLVAGVAETYTLAAKKGKTKITWTSSDSKVAMISGRTVTILSTGVATLTARYGKKKKIVKAIAADFTDMEDQQRLIISYALQFVGNPYVYGKSSLTRGTDCSGFTMSVFKQFGYSLPHNAAAQMQSSNKIAKDQLDAGDLIFYGSGSSCGHVALYIGNGMVVHASNPSVGITVSRYDYRASIGYGRVLQTNLEIIGGEVAPED